jgi:hypothetical protein
MQSLAEVVNASADSVTIANHDTLEPFTAPPTNDLFIDTGYTKLFARDLISNSSGTYYFEMAAEKLPKIIDLSKLLCEVSFSVVKVVGGREYACVPYDGVSVTNSFVDSLFSKIEITINQAPAYVSPSNRYQYIQLNHLVSGVKTNQGKGMGHLSFSYPEEYPESTVTNKNPHFKARSDRICSPPPGEVGGKELYAETKLWTPVVNVDDYKVADTASTADKTKATIALALALANAKAITEKRNRAQNKFVHLAAEQVRLRNILENGSVADQQEIRGQLQVPTVYGMGVLTTGFSNSRQYLPWDSAITVTVTKESDLHLLQVGADIEGGKIATPSEGQFRVKIKNLSLFYRHYILNDSAYVQQAALYRAGKRSKIYYLKPYTNALCMQMGQQLYVQDIGFAGRRLAKLFVVFMSSERYVGSYEQASNVYEPPPALRSAELLFNGRDPLQLDASTLRSTENSAYEKLYFDYLSNTQILGRETENNTLSFDQFKRSAFVLSLNLVASGLLESERLPLLKTGIITLRLELEQPLPSAWYVYYLAYGVAQMDCAPGEIPQMSEKLQALQK